MGEPTTEFRKRLAEALSIRNMKQIELSEKTDIPKSAINQYLSGRMIPRHSRIFLLAQTLDVDEAWLMGFNVPMERKTFIEIEESDLANLQMRTNAFMDSLRLKNMLDKFSQLSSEQQTLIESMIDQMLK